MRHLFIALRVALRTFVIRYRGTYLCSGWDGYADFTKIRYKGRFYYLPPVHDHDSEGEPV